MRIGIDGRVTSAHFPGIGRYCLNLITELLKLETEHRWFVLYDPRHNPELAALATEQRGSSARFVALPVAVRSPAEQAALPALVAQLRLDLFHATYYALPPLLRGRLAVTLYDLIPQLYPTYWPNPIVRRAISGWGALALRRAATVLTLSEATRQDLGRVYGPTATARPIVVTPCGAEPRFLTLGQQRTRSGAEFEAPERPYFLYVGINKPHKNLVRLVQAFDLYRAQGGDSDLIIAGRWDARYPEAGAEVDHRRLGERVRFRHDVSEAELAALYTGAQAFAFPSLYEGFGFPVLEAMAAALPVLAGSASSLPEIGGDAVLYCDPTNVRSIADGLIRLGGDADLRRTLSHAGYERARAFTWRRTAEATLAAYEATAHAVTSG